MNLVEQLNELGFSTKEAKVYLATLKLGTAKASTISEEANVRRETTYNILSNLTDKGFISTISKHGVNHYDATDPDFIRQKIQEKARTAETILPDLQELQESHVSKPSIEFYEGRSGVKSILEHVLQANPDMVRVISSNKNVKEVLEPYIPNFYLQKRIQQNIKVRLLTDSALLTDELVEYTFLPNEINLNTLNHIYDDTISMISLAEARPVGTIIHDENIVNTQRQMFDLLWSQLNEQ